MDLEPVVVTGFFVCAEILSISDSFFFQNNSGASTNSCSRVQLTRLTNDDIPLSTLGRPAIIAMRWNCQLTDNPICSFGARQHQISLVKLTVTSVSDERDCQFARYTLPFVCVCFISGPCILILVVTQRVSFVTLVLALFTKYLQRRDFYNRYFSFTKQRNQFFLIITTIVFVKAPLIQEFIHHKITHNIGMS